MLAKDEQGIKELAAKYGIKLKHLAMGILPEEDALECVNDTFLVYPAETEYAGNRFIEAYLVDDSVIYEISVSCFEHNQEDISQLVKNWLDQL